MAKKWTADDIPNQEGKVVLITGANSGIGFETALALAGKQSRLFLAVRSLAKGEAAAQKIRVLYPSVSLEVLLLDLADLDSLRQFADSFLAQHQALDILINNAGVMTIPFQRTVDGFERQFGTNHLGHFALTGLLLPAILAAPAARVVTVSSLVNILGRIDFENLDGSKFYHSWLAYNQSKLANLIFAYHLQRWFEAHRARAISIGCHPGYSATDLQLVGPRLSGARWMEAFMRWANRTFAQSAAMGALPALYAATATDVRGGDYIGPQGLTSMSGYPDKARSNKYSHDLGTAQRLWEVSERLTGVRYEERI